MKNCLIIFTRKPEKGKVKTRLAQGVGDDKALEIYKFLLQHTAKVTAKVKAHKQVYYTKAIAKNDFWDDKIFEKKVQIDGDLGQKMQQAFEQAFQDGFEKVVIIGSDLYDINHKLIDKAFAKLDHNDAVIGPATDGGYYLLGTKSIFPEVFKNKPWGTDEVLNLTLQDLKSKQVALLEAKNDIDYLEDLNDFTELKMLLE
ncbi:TIGR04282 family arsenosugar biosynthesis glycosyltransferase [Flavobacteriaceae bacterium 14752]|uniref:TIGR04282 family arsenosugar biosynthesis glycosyltransferase n=1 Tax=Mesohalobacter salilacus TaxID=2491711 RepID=UPI000F62D236|nr:glycosyltransferase [Flavobacteriaceae bacterium 14752]